MKNIFTIIAICGLAQFTFSQNFGIDQSSPLVKLHVNGNAFFDLPSGGGALENSFTIKKTGLGQVNFGSYPGAWTPALQIQSNDNSRYLWMSPLTAGGNARLVSIGADFDIMPGNSWAATFFNGGTSTGDLRFNYSSCANGYCPSNNVIRHTPNLHLNSYNGYAVILNWDNGTTGANQTFRIGNGAGSDAFYVYADGQAFTGNWWRSNGNSGWYSQSYGGGWYMEDGTWIRSYGNKSVHINRSGYYAFHPYSPDYTVIYSVCGTNGYWNGQFVGSDYSVYAQGYVYATTYGYLSSREKKKEIVKFSDDDYESALAFVDKLDLNYYKYKDDKFSTATQVGFIAEETPGALTTPGKQGARYGELSIYNTGAIRVLKKKVEQLESQMRNVSDFGSGNVSSGTASISFSNEFKSLLNGAVPTVVVTPFQSGIALNLVNVTKDGFTVKNPGNATVNFNWIAMAKAPVQRNSDDENYSAKFKQMLESAEYEATHKEYPKTEGLQPTVHESVYKTNPEKFVGPDRTPVHDPSINDPNKLIKDFNEKTKTESAKKTEYNKGQ